MPGLSLPVPGKGGLRGYFFNCTVFPRNARDRLHPAVPGGKGNDRVSDFGVCAPDSDQLPKSPKLSAVVMAWTRVQYGAKASHRAS